MENVIKEAYEKTKQVRINSYAPYSNFLVGAAIKAKNSSKIYTGCNVENTSYGATVCAERVAMCNLISDIGKAEIDFVVITADCDAVLPCGMCLQFLSEFCSPEMPIYLSNLTEIYKTVLLKELMPMKFTIGA